MFYFPCHSSGPMTLEWSAASYERMQAQRDYRDSHTEEDPVSWDDAYVKSACQVEYQSLRRILDKGYSSEVTYEQRLAL